MKMKKLLVVLLFFITLNSYSQSNYANFLATKIAEETNGVTFNEDIDDSSYSIAIILPKYYNIDLSISKINRIIKSYSDILVFKAWSAECSKDGINYYKLGVLISEDYIVTISLVPQSDKIIVVLFQPRSSYKKS